MVLSLCFLFSCVCNFQFQLKALCCEKSRIMSTTVKAGSSGSGRQGFKHSIKMSYDEGRNTLRRMGRKISKLDTSDLDAQTIMKIGTFFLGFLIFFYSLQIFLMLLPILYPAYQTIKVLQVLISIKLKIFFLSIIIVQTDQDCDKERSCDDIDVEEDIYVIYALRIKYFYGGNTYIMQHLLER